jgi:hypothetical protein
MVPKTQPPWNTLNTAISASPKGWV